MGKWECYVCAEEVPPTMCQSAIEVDGVSNPAHIACAEEWSEREIDVWKVTVPGSCQGYYEEFLGNVTEMLKEMDDESEYVIRKERMKQGKYHALPEFAGF